MRKCKTLINYFRLKSDVITILKLRTELIDKAVKLIEKTEDNIVSKQRAELTFNLYKKLLEMNEPRQFRWCDN